MIRVLITSLACLVALILAAHADDEREPLQEKIAVGLSQEDVDITADFSGEEILVYGAIERSRFLHESEAPPDVIIVVEGPSRPNVVRRKERIVGVWVNRSHSVISAAPSFYAVGSTRPLDEILTPHQIEIHDIGLEQVLLVPGEVSDGGDPELYRDAAVRLLRNAGFYRILPGSVRVPGESLFSSRIRLPASIVEGDYRLRIHLARDGIVTDTHELIIPVRRAALEQWIYRSAHEDPLGYALASILVAILAGWAASALFRRIRI